MSKAFTNEENQENEPEEAEEADTLQGEKNYLTPTGQAAL